MAWAFRSKGKFFTVFLLYISTFLDRICYHLRPNENDPLPTYFNASKWCPTSPPAILIICWVGQRLLKYNVNTPNIKCNFSRKTEQCVTPQSFYFKEDFLSLLCYGTTPVTLCHIPLFIQIIPDCADSVYCVLHSLLSPSPWIVNFTTIAFLVQCILPQEHKYHRIQNLRSLQCLAHCRNSSNICWKNGWMFLHSIHMADMQKIFVALWII